jgi:hypothetical protein
VVAEQKIIALEEQLYGTRDTAERHRLLQAFIKELDNLSHDVVSTATLARRRVALDERFKIQKELVERLKREGHDPTDAYFLLITLKTMMALCACRQTLARNVLICTVTRRPD